jgi:hypothetical protein
MYYEVDVCLFYFCFALYRATLVLSFRERFLSFKKEKVQMDPSGFEPEASRVQGGRSTRLIYGPARYR